MCKDKQHGHKYDDFADGRRVHRGGHDDEQAAAGGGGVQASPDAQAEGMGEAAGQVPEGLQPVQRAAQVDCR